MAVAKDARKNMPQTISGVMFGTVFQKNYQCRKQVVALL